MTPQMGTVNDCNDGPLCLKDIKKYGRLLCPIP
jgi:hypothetical protein